MKLTLLPATLVTVFLSLTLAASVALSAPAVKVFGSGKRATLKVVSTDEGFKPARVAVHAGALVTLFFKVDQSHDSYQMGQSIFGPNFKNEAINNGQTVVLKFRAPKTPGKPIKFSVWWQHRAQFKYNGQIGVVK